MDSPRSDLAEAALRYAELGYRVFPCAPGTKEPLTKNGFHDATADVQQIEKWWTERPNANIGLPTEGLVVIDVDRDDNPWLKSDPDRRLSLAAGPVSLTPRTGFHYIFRQPAGKVWSNTVRLLAPDVDTRANGGYIVLPPSVLEGGRAYRWAPSSELDVSAPNLPEPPGWLVAELDRLATGAPTLAPGEAGAPDADKIPA